MKMPFYCWHCERKNIYSRIRNWIRNFLLPVVKEDPDPNPKLGQKWDPNPDPDRKKLFRIHNTGTGTGTVPVLHTGIVLCTGTRIRIRGFYDLFSYGNSSARQTGSCLKACKIDYR
jgi:hypothetical protein